MIIEVPTRAVAKQRPRTVNGNTYTPPKTRQFEEFVAWQTRSQRDGVTLEDDLRVTITLIAKRRLTGDVDNYAKAVLDGVVKGGAIKDDSQIVDLRVLKMVGRHDQIQIVLETA